MSLTQTETFEWLRERSQRLDLLEAAIRRANERSHSDVAGWTQRLRREDWRDICGLVGTAPPAGGAPDWHRLYSDWLDETAQRALRGEPAPTADEACARFAQFAAERFAAALPPAGGEAGAREATWLEAAKVCEALVHAFSPLSSRESQAKAEICACLAADFREAAARPAGEPRERDSKDVTCECGRGPVEIAEHTDEAGVTFWWLANLCTQCLEPVSESQTIHQNAAERSSEPCSGGAIGRHLPSSVENRDSEARSPSLPASAPPAGGEAYQEALDDFFGALAVVADRMDLDANGPPPPGKQRSTHAIAIPMHVILQTRALCEARRAALAASPAGAREMEDGGHV